MIPAYTLNRGYAVFFMAFSVIGERWLVSEAEQQLRLKASSSSALFPHRNLLSDEPADRHHLQPVQGIFAGEFTAWMRKTEPGSGRKM